MIRLDFAHPIMPKHTTAKSVYPAVILFRQSLASPLGLAVNRDAISPLSRQPYSSYTGTNRAHTLINPILLQVQGIPSKLSVISSPITPTMQPLPPTSRVELLHPEYEQIALNDKVEEYLFAQLGNPA